MRTVTQRRSAGPAARFRPPDLDLVIAGAFLVLASIEALTAGGPRPLLVHLVVAGLAMVALAWRRRFPLLVALVTVTANFIVNPEDQFSTLLALVLVSYSLGLYSPPPRTYVGLAVLVTTLMVASVPEGFEPSDAAAALVFLVGPWAVGRMVLQRSEHAAEALSRADRAERERDLQTRLAVAEERTRIARELHDIVSHSISVVTIQTQAVRRRLLPDQEREAADLAAVEGTAREALAEMRRLFGVLRADGEDASLSPQPGLAELDRLVSAADSPELAVRLSVRGTPYPLPPGVDLAAYRVAQEGLTNALRHSGGSQVEVVVHYEPQHVEVEVTDNGRGTDGSNREDGRGHGLVGVRERVALYQGSVSFDHLPTGGSRLVARLPVSAPA
nr:sensor histidine kinase [uncultured Friedmanniella sp.]